MAFLAPLFFLGLAAIAVPVFVHLIQRERKDVIEFPSLMFIQRIPYQSVERRRIHNWWLFLLRAAAMALIVIAFSRPFFKSDAVTAAAAATGARDVVILLDRSASMGYGAHWTRAQDEARKIVSGLGTEDRASLLLFDSGVEETVRTSVNHAELTTAINAASVSASATRYAPALREAQSLLSRSDRGRKEAFLISDFQKTGWERQEDIRLPEGATITPISVADMETANLAISSVAIQRASFSGQERVTLTAGLINRSATPVNARAVTLEINGRAVGSRDISLAPHATGAVTFDQVTVAESNIRGIVRAGTDAMASDNNFFFVLSPSRSISVLVLQADGANSDAGLYLSTGLTLSKTPPFKVEVEPLSRFSPGQLDGRAVVVLNNVAALGTVNTQALQRFAEQGGGVFVVLGNNTPVSGEWALLPGSLGPPVDRSGLRGGSLGTPDSSHPIFQQFKDPRTSTFANVRFFRYRRLATAPTDRVLVRFDDGAAAVAERRVGNGRVVVFTSTLDAEWNDLPRQGMFLPMLHETMKYLAQYTEEQPSHVVGRMLDISAAVAELVRDGQATRTAGESGVVVAPSGAQVTLGGSGGVPSIEMAEQGFYSVRLPGMGARRPYTVAVNIDPAESDLTVIPPADLLASATGQSAAVAQGQSLEARDITPVDVEKKQSLWWFLLVAGLALLLAEAVLSNRLSRHLRPQSMPTV